MTSIFKVEDNAAASVTPAAGCVIVMPGDLVNDEDEDEVEEEDDERNSETAALTSSC